MTQTPFEPRPLQEWANENEPAPDLRWREGYWRQIMFVRDKLPRAVVRTQADYDAYMVGLKVVSTHRSKSVTLPVFRLTLPTGAILTMRYNFYNWKVSVDSPVPVALDLAGIAATEDEPINPIYCEGFDPSWVYGRYADDHPRFTVELYDDYQLWALCWQLAKCV